MNNMYIVASFHHSMYLEIAVSEIEETGIAQERILVIPLDKRNEKPRLLDSMYYADGSSLIDLALALGTVGMLLGSMYGFLFTLGPVLWALFGLVGGGLIGFAIKYAIYKRTSKRRFQMDSGWRKRPSEVFVMIHCPAEKSQEVERILWAHHALGVGQLSDEQQAGVG